MNYFRVLIFTIISISCYGQELSRIGFDGSYINLDDSTCFNYIMFDSSNSWQISDFQKQILYLPENYTSIEKSSLFSNSDMYYRNNLKTWVQFKLLFDGNDGYYINFSHKYDFDKYHDGGSIETSFDNGLTWNNILKEPRIEPNIINLSSNFYKLDDAIQAIDGKFGFTGRYLDIDEFVSIAIKSDEQLSGDTMLLRFVLYSDSVDNKNEGWMIKDIKFGGWVEDLINVNEFTKQIIEIFPNPASDYVKINLDEKIRSVKIVDLSGKTIKSVYNSNYILLADLNSGFYLFYINDKYRKKIIKI